MLHDIVQTNGASAAKRQDGKDVAHTHTHILESNPGKTRKNAPLENAGPTEITEACRQTAPIQATELERLQINAFLNRILNARNRASEAPNRNIS